MTRGDGVLVEGAELSGEDAPVPGHGHGAGDGADFPAHGCRRRIGYLDRDRRGLRTTTGLGEAVPLLDDRVRVPRYLPDHSRRCCRGGGGGGGRAGGGGRSGPGLGGWSGGGGVGGGGCCRLTAE